MLEEGQTRISARLAEELDVTPPAVTAALKRMTRDDFLRMERTGRIELTRKGRKAAEWLGPPPHPPGERRPDNIWGGLGERDDQTASPGRRNLMEGGEVGP